MRDFAEQLLETAAEALPPVEGDVVAPGLAAPVEILRDSWGVPYLTAASADDLWFAQGFVTASERLFQLDLALRAANGRLSELFAELTLPMDRLVRTIGLNRAGSRIAAGYDDRSRSMTRRFRSGALAWLTAMPAPPPEYALLGASPELPDDDASWAAATAYLAWELSGNCDTELLRAAVAERLGAQALGELFPGAPAQRPELVAGAVNGDLALALLHAAPSRPPGRGSNSWVVSGDRSEHGKPLLANDPHLDVQQPSAWLEMHLNAPGYEARGVAVPFLPGIVIGTTAHHAWGVTNVTGDTQDLFVERLNDDRSAASFRDAWEPLAMHHETISVRSRAEPEVIEIRETRHGPILDAYTVGVLDPDIVEGALTETYALRWVGADRSIMPSAFVAVAQAEDFSAFREAVRAVECPGQNFVYADTDGHIGYQCTGRYPVRRSGDGTFPVPGWTGEAEWDGFVPFEELPWCADPERGFVVTANNRIHDDAYPHLIGRDFHTPFRARRVTELLGMQERHTIESFAAMQADTVSIPAREMLPALLDLEPASHAQAQALALLSGWDADVAADSSAAAVFQVWARAIARRLLEPRLGPDLFARYYAWRETFHCGSLPAILSDARSAWWGDDGREALLRGALDDALGELEERLGPDRKEWAWGRLHRARFAGPLARMPGLEEVFTAADVELGGDEQTISQAGFDARDGFQAAVVQSWRQVFDLGDLDRSVGVLPTGQSGNPASPHWNDQAGVWASGGHHPLPFSRAAVEGHAQTAGRLVPR